MFQILVTMVTVVTGVSGQFCSCRPHCLKVLLWMYLLMFCCDSNSNKITSAVSSPGTTKDPCEVITPRDAFFLEGEDMVLTCNGHDSEMLTFVRGRTLIPVTEELGGRSSTINKINETAIQLVVPNVTANDIQSPSLSTPYKCVNKYNTSQCYDVIHLRLDYYPREPKNLVCRDYDLEEMYCTWSFGVDYRNSFVKCEVAQFMFKSDNFEANWAPCPSQNNTYCHLDASTYASPTMMKAKVSVTARNITKETIKEFNIYDIVEPGPVTDLTVTEIDGSRRCVKLAWKPSESMMFYSFKFEITYTSTCSGTEVTKKNYFVEKLDNTVQWDTRICGLTPYTEYTYSVRGRMIEEKEVDNKTFIERGHWSMARTVAARTAKDVIDVSPETVPGLYEILSLTRPGLQLYDALHLYWTPLTDCDLHDDAEGVTYKVTAHNKTTSVTHPRFEAQIDIPEGRVVNITLQAYNSEGGSPDSLTVVTAFPEKFGPMTSELLIQYNNTDDTCVTQADVIFTESRDRFTNIFHRIVWCEGTQLLCQKPLKFTELRANVTSFVVPGNLCESDFRYGLVTYGYSKGLGRVVDTGIHWEPCIYELGKVVDKPVKDERLSENQPDNGFSVEWTPFTCQNMKAYIAYYNITYCVGKGIEDCKCIQKAVNVTISRKLSKYTASNLEAGSTVCIWIRGVSNAGEGPVNTKALVHDIFDKSGSSFLPLLIVTGVLVGVVLIVGIVLLCRNKLKALKEGAEIRIPGHDPQQDFPLVNSIHNTSDLTSDEETEPLHPSQMSVYRDTGDGSDNEETNRTYSLHDITDALYQETALPGTSDHLEGNDQFENLYQVGDTNNNTSDRNHDSFSTYVKAEHIGNMDNEETKRLKPIPLTGSNFETEHCRDSISSELSDAHTEAVCHSKEDLFRDSFDTSRLMSDIFEGSPTLKSFLQSENQENLDIGIHKTPPGVKGHDIYKTWDHAGTLLQCKDDVEIVINDNSQNGDGNCNTHPTNSALHMTDTHETFEKQMYKPVSAACNIHKGGLYERENLETETSDQAVKMELGNFNQPLEGHYNQDNNSDILQLKESENAGDTDGGVEIEGNNMTLTDSDDKNQDRNSENSNSLAGNETFFSSIDGSVESIKSETYEGKEKDTGRDSPVSIDNNGYRTIDTVCSFSDIQLQAGTPEINENNAPTYVKAEGDSLREHQNENERSGKYLQRKCAQKKDRKVLLKPSQNEQDNLVNGKKNGLKMNHYHFH